MFLFAVMSTFKFFVIFIVTLFCTSIVSSSSADDGSTSTLPSSLRERLKEIRAQSTKWLWSQKTDEYGWPSGDTPRAVVTLASALQDWPAKDDLEARLVVKQLEIELLEKLLRKDIDPVTPTKVAYYCLALNAVCKEPSNFYGHNLIASIEQHHEEDEDTSSEYPESFGYSLSALITCISGSHIHRKQARHLLRISRDEKDKLHSLDTRSTALMALECFRRRKHSEALSSYMVQPLAQVAAKQQEDGSFGNLYTTTVAIQALTASSVHLNANWNQTAAAVFLISQQESDGSFGHSLQGTSEVILALSSLLNPDGILRLTKTRCEADNWVVSTRPVTNTSISEPSSNSIVKEQTATQPRQVTTIGPPLSKTQDSLEVAVTWNVLDTTGVLSEPGEVTTEPPFVNVSYWLWIGPDPLTAEKHNITFPVPLNSTFFYVMQRAAELDSDFEFSSTVWPNGHYVHTISGHREQPVGYHYWLLYCLTVEPDPAAPPPTTFVAPAGVDDLKVQDGQVYLFWFKKI